jgi:hypothetical protein
MQSKRKRTSTCITPKQHELSLRQVCLVPRNEDHQASNKTRWMSKRPSQSRKSSEKQYTTLEKATNRSPVLTEVSPSSSIARGGPQRNSRRTINSTNSAEFSNAFSRMFCSAELQRRSVGKNGSVACSRATAAKPRNSNHLSTFFDTFTSGLSLPLRMPGTSVCTEAIGVKKCSTSDLKSNSNYSR